MKLVGSHTNGPLRMAALGLLLAGLNGCQALRDRAVSSPDEVATLREMVQAQQQQIDTLRQEVRKDAQAEPKPDQAEPAGPKWEPVDYLPRAELRGRIHADAVFVDQSERNKQTVGDLENATGFRRARLGAQGRAGEQVRWVAEFDFAASAFQLIDVYVAADKLPVITEVRVGHLAEPLSLDALTSSRFTTFLERTGNNPLDPGQNWGLAFYRTAADERSTWQLGGFRDGSDGVGLDVTDQGDWALTTRATRLLWYDEAADGRSLLHVGGALSLRRPRDRVATFRERSGGRLIAVGEPSISPFLPVLNIPARDFQQYNLEAAAVLGPLSLQAEWGCAAVDQTGGGFVFLHGFYLAASYFLTGEHRAYAKADGTFDRTRVLAPFFALRGVRGFIHGPGAWELVARCDYTDFRDSNSPRGPGGVPVGDLLLQGTVGLNWYLNDYARVMFNCIAAELQSPAFGTSRASLFSTRFALFW